MNLDTPRCRDALAHTPTDKWMTAREIWRAAGCWGDTSIKIALDKLFAAGIIQRKSERIGGGIRHCYRKISA